MTPVATAYPYPCYLQFATNVLRAPFSVRKRHAESAKMERAAREAVGVAPKA